MEGDRGLLNRERETETDRGKEIDVERDKGLLTRERETEADRDKERDIERDRGLLNREEETETKNCLLYTSDAADDC